MQRPSSRQRSAPLSLEACLDEENREVVAALDGMRQESPARRINRNNSPAPIRSMLDVPDSPSSTPRHGSIAGIGVGVTSPRQTKSRALDPSDPSTWTSPHSSKSNSPTLTRAEPARQRGGSDSQATQGYVGLSSIDHESDGGFEKNYQFDLSSIPSNTRSSPSANEPKRHREGSGGALAAALSGDLANYQVGKVPSSKQESNLVTAAAHSRSPSGRVRSPTENRRTPSASPAGQYVTPKGTVVDKSSHHRLSNKSNSFSATDESEGDGQGTRVEVGEEDALEEYSDENGHSSDSEDEDRGRNRDRSSDSLKEPLPPDDTDATSPDTPGSAQGPVKRLPHSQIIKSMLEPSISVTSPTGESLPESGGVHPPSNFAKRRMSASTNMSGDDGDGDDIAKAKSLGLSISPLDTKVPDRHVRMIIRGDWSTYNKEAQDGDRTLRTYLACSDLSVEAMYALEWTVGTIMRDGDTLLAVYAIEDETAGSPPNDNKVTEAQREALRQEGAKAGKDANDAMDTLTRQTTNIQAPSNQSKFIPATETQSLTGSVDARKVSKKEMERLKAIDEITQTFLRLVRKTSLQVRCMIEVIHCKSPKHLILGAIDELEPTLTVVGTRGRSSLKGVLLGSFSNYLVTKSSSPVMVARKKLKKPKSQVRIGSNKIRLSNNLMASSIPGKRRSLTQARID